MTEAGATPGGLWRPRLAGVARELFYVDLRSLALLRVCLGLLILADLATRARHFTAHYTDLGVAPRELIFGEYGMSCYFSVHWWLRGSVTAEALVFVVGGLFAVGLIAGRFTRIMTAGCWYLQASLLVSMPLLHTAGDRTLQLMLFWSLFLPVGARWSLDASKRVEVGAKSNTYVSVAGFAILMQVCFVYWFAVMLKMYAPMWREGYAVAFTLTRDSYVTAFGAWVRQHESILGLLTLSVLSWELIGPLLAFVPMITAIGRLAAIVGFWLLHIGFGLCFDRGVFAWISSAAWLVFVPTEFWDRVLPGSRTDPAAEPLRPRRVETIAAAAFLAIVVALNVRSIPHFRKLVPSFVVQAGNAMRLGQNWGMFTKQQDAQGRANNGRFVIAATLADGSEIDLLADGAPVSWDLPESGARRYGTARWSQFHYFYYELSTSPYWPPYVDYLCRPWNQRLGDDGSIDRIAIWFLVRPAAALGNEQVRPVLFYEGGCDLQDG